MVLYSTEAYRRRIHQHTAVLQGGILDRPGSGERRYQDPRCNHCDQRGSRELFTLACSPRCRRRVFIFIFPNTYVLTVTLTLVDLLDDRLNIPFAATEYAEQSLVLASESVPRFFRETLTRSSYMSPEFRQNMTKQGQRSYSVTVNPFHRPGARSGVSAWTMPNYYNGFVLPVVLKV